MAMPLILIADDFGLSRGINRAILELIALGRLSGTSVMVNMPGLAPDLSNLKAVHHQVEIGLHLNLTEGRPISAMPHYARHGIFPSLTDVMLRAHSGQIRQSEMEAEIRSQLELFRTQFGFLPEYIDGHQHVHILPTIRTALLNVLRSYSGYAPWLRVPSDNVAAFVGRRVAIAKSAFIAALSYGLKRAVSRSGLRTNASFSGIHDFRDDVDYAQIFPQFLRYARAQHVVMCHPGYMEHGNDLNDPIRHARYAELEFLKSSNFQAVLQDHQFYIGKF